MSELIPQNKLRTGVSNGRFKRGQSGNPGGRPRGLARVTREAVGDDGAAIVEFWLGVMRDSTCKVTERLEASRLLADRGWGKAGAFQLIEDNDPFGQSEEQLDAAVEQFCAEVTRLAGLNDARIDERKGRRADAG